MKEPLKRGQRGMQGRLAQQLAGSLAFLFGQVVLERNRLLVMECLELLEMGIFLESGQRLGGGIHRLLTLAFCFLQITLVSG